TRPLMHVSATSDQSSTALHPYASAFVSGPLALPRAYPRQIDVAACHFRAPAWPANAALRGACKRYVGPPLFCLNALNNIHPCHTVVFYPKVDTMTDTKQAIDQQNTENKHVVAAGPVSRILSAGFLRQDGHSSGRRITTAL